MAFDEVTAGAVLPDLSGVDYLTAKGAAERLGYAKTTIQTLCRKGRLRAGKCLFGRGYFWVIPISEVERYFAYRHDPLDRRRPRGGVRRERPSSYSGQSERGKERP